MDRPGVVSHIAHHSRTRFFGALCLVWLLLNLPVLTGLRVTPWDAIDEFYPTVLFNARALRAGMWPWWNPYIYAGFPQVADPQGMLFSPLLMGWMLLIPDPGATWFNWGVLLHLLMGGACMGGFLRLVGNNRFGCMIGAMVFMAGGVAASRLEHVPDVLAYAWAPVVLLAMRRFIDEPSWRRGAAWGLAAAALSTQLVQVAYLLAMVIAGYFVASSASRWRGYDTARRRRWLAGTTAAAALAATGALPQVVFTWAFVSLSNRAILPLGAAADASLDARSLLTLFDPNAWHALRGAYDGAASRVEGYLYIGSIPMLMIPGLRRAWACATQRRHVIYFVIVALLSCLYMFGTHSPFYRWLYEWMPGLKQFRRPSDAAYVLNFSLAIFAGLGAGRLDLGSRRSVASVLVISAAWLALASLHMRGNGVSWQAPTLAAALVALMALWRLRGIADARRAALWLVAVLVVDYRCFNLNGAFNQGHDNARRMLHDDTTAFLVRANHQDPSGFPGRIEPFSAGVLWDNYVVLARLESTQGYNPLRYRLYDRWYGAHENGNFPRPSTPYNLAAGSRLDDLLGVRYVVAAPGAGPESALARSGLRKLHAGTRTEVWLNPEAYPRILLPTHARLTRPGTPPSPEEFAATDFTDTVWLTPRDQHDLRGDVSLLARCTGKARVERTAVSASRIDLDVRTAAPGWLVLSELDYPGWLAELDGDPLTIHRANGMFRAVCVPAGAHHLRLAFHPWNMVLEAWRRRSD